jgi:hypothetical protein
MTRLAIYLAYYMRNGFVKEYGGKTIVRKED